MGITIKKLNIADRPISFTDAKFIALSKLNFQKAVNSINASICSELFKDIEKKSFSVSISAQDIDTVACDIIADMYRKEKWKVDVELNELSWIFNMSI